MMKRTNLFYGFLLLLVAGFISSCTQEEREEMPERKTTVEELTAQLRAYNASLGVMVPIDVETQYAWKP